MCFFDSLSSYYSFFELLVLAVVLIIDWLVEVYFYRLLGRGLLHLLRSHPLYQQALLPLLFISGDYQAVT